MKLPNNGQNRNSPFINGGDRTAKGLRLKKTITRTDGERDKQAVDMGLYWGRWRHIWRRCVVDPLYGVA